MNRLLTSSLSALLSLLLLSALISCGDAAATPQSTLKNNKSTTQKRISQVDAAASPLFGVRGKINRRDNGVDDGDASAFCVRGGGCCDTTPILMGKVGVGAAIETTLMYQLLKLSTNINFVSSLTKRIIQTTTLLLIIFASSTFGSIVDMGLSAASKQVLDPNSTPNPDWYSGLKKPKWNPPGWIFPIMWLIVSKPTQFIAVSKLIATQSKNGVDYPNLPLLAYCTHLALGDAWNKVFFGLQCTGRGLAVILTFWSVLWTCVYLFYQVDETAGLFLVPTGLWVTVAAALNWSIYFQNK
jgi:tryptophan-rich sensory protein